MVGGVSRLLRCVRGAGPKVAERQLLRRLDTDACADGTVLFAVRSIRGYRTGFWTPLNLGFRRRFRGYGFRFFN